MAEFKPLARKNDIVVQEIDGETLIYDLAKNKSFALNQTSSIVWQLCDGKNKVTEIADKLTIELKQFVSEDLVWFSLEQLEKDGLIENEFKEISRFESLSRREVIRKIGFASMVSLPIISTIIAPLATHAQSGCTTGGSGRALGCPCTAIPQCVGTPASTRCCSDVPGTPRVCVVANTLRSPGQSCGNNCDCTSNICVDPVGPTTGTCA